MKKTIFSKLFLLLLLTIVFRSYAERKAEKPRILVFSKTAGFHHSSIKQGNIALIKLGQENGFEVDTTTLSESFREKTLSKYSAVVFLNTTGDLLNQDQENDFERYIQAGGGYVGVHAAADAEYDWKWYGQLVGGYFQTHPEVQVGTLTITDKKHPSTSFLPDTWVHRDEWYRFKELSDQTYILMTIDKAVYRDEKITETPMAWYHEFDGGRAFYTGLGHQGENFSDVRFVKHLLGGIAYASGGDYLLDHQNKSQRTGEEERLSKVSLIKGQLDTHSVAPPAEVTKGEYTGLVGDLENRKASPKTIRFYGIFERVKSDRKSGEIIKI